MKRYCCAGLLLLLFFTASFAAQPEVFEPVEFSVAEELESDVREQHEIGNLQLGYLRHRLVRINVANLTRLLKGSLNAANQGDKDHSFPLQLFDDKSINVLVNQWSHGNFGVNLAIGESFSSSKTILRAKFVFVEDDLNGIEISTPDRWYRVQKSSHPQIFIVYESEHVSADM